MSIPEGWTIKRTDQAPFKSIKLSYIKEDVRYDTVVYSHDRNPANILYMLADDLLGLTLL